MQAAFVRKSSITGSDVGMVEKMFSWRGRGLKLTVDGGNLAVKGGSESTVCVGDGGASGLAPRIGGLGASGCARAARVARSV